MKIKHSDALLKAARDTVKAIEASEHEEAVNAYFILVAQIRELAKVVEAIDLDQ